MTPGLNLIGSVHEDASSVPGETTAVSRAKELVKDMEKEACHGYSRSKQVGDRLHDIS